MYIPNQWYAILETDELKAGEPQSFKRLGLDLVGWRDAESAPVIMEDRCAHRQVKLSRGKIVDNCIECPFHGFRYDAEGACRRIPANGVNGPVPKIFRVKTYAVREEHGFIWLWTGEVQAEYPPVPFFPELNGFIYSTLRKPWPVDHSRAIENQLDVAHLPFVHATTIGRGGRTLVDGPFSKLEDDALYVWTRTELDVGKPAPKPSEVRQPDGPWGLCFKFPNVWTLRITGQLHIMVAFAPVDDENTMMYVRFYHNFVKNPLARRVIAKIGALSNNRILKQDERVVFTHRPKAGGLDSGDKYIPADRPIVLYYQHRDKLIEEGKKLVLLGEPAGERVG